MRRKAQQIVIVGGPVNIAYRRRQKQWYCTALEFDLVGIGPTREAALEALQEVFDSYLEAVFDAEEPVQFFNPSEAGEWDIVDRENYQILAFLKAPKPESPPIPNRIDHRKVRNYRDRISSFALAPVGT